MSVSSILERLAPHVEREVNLILNSKHEAQTLKSKLERIHEGLQDAERHGVTDQNVKRWLGELEDVMNEMDDALDQWETMNIEQQMEQLEFDNLFDGWEKVRSLLLSVCSSFKHVLRRRKLTKEMIALSGRLDKILEVKGRYNFVSSDGISSPQVEKQETTSFVDKSKVHGRKYDTNWLVELLLGNGDERSGPLVVSVVGTGGLGKTTLAQLVYNDDGVKKHFGRLKAWVSVPEPFDALPIAKGIIAAFDKTSIGREYSLEVLGQRLKAIVSRKNFLLVLDNVGTVDRNKWESLANIFVGETGFSILATTRNEKTAKSIGSDHLQRLNFLSDSDCSTILNTIALKETRGDKHKEFLEIGVEIAKKCNGLPLAAKTIGHALESRSTIKEWRDILESRLWMYKDEMSDILRPLRLSYLDLSPLLKRCFLSSVLYSKGFNFDSKGLIRIWMAQHYVDSSADSDPKGEEHLKKLSERSFFQVSGRNDEGEPTYKMHDIMYDFATHQSGNEYYIIIDGRTDRSPYRKPTHGKTRYFSARSVSQKDLPRNLLSLLNRARVLCLSDCDFEEFSKYLGELIHLRYLDLSGNPMKELPETVSDLYNLQTLDLRRCRYLTRLPRRLEKLKKLRHLLISDTDNLLEFHEELSKLTGLWTLDKCAATRDSLVNSNNSPRILGSGTDEADMTCVESTEMRYSDRFTCLGLLNCFATFCPTTLLKTEFQYDGQPIAAAIDTCTDIAFWNGAPCQEHHDQLAQVELRKEETCSGDKRAEDKYDEVEYLQEEETCLFDDERAEGEYDEVELNKQYLKMELAELEQKKETCEDLMRNYQSNRSDCSENAEDKDTIFDLAVDQFQELSVAGFETACKITKLEDLKGKAAAARRPQPRLTGDVKLQLLPSTMAVQYLNNVKSLDINGSEYSHLPQLENLPMLVTLRIQKMDFRAVALEFFAGGFPKLETLTFSECKLWEEWEDLEEDEDEGVLMPRLNYLAITLCPNLNTLPQKLLRAATSLQELFVAGCPLLAAAYNREMGGGWDQISHIPNTIILESY